MTTLIDIPVAKIKPHPKNPRTEIGDVTELAASIAAAGVHQPLVVVPDTRPRAAAGAHLLIMGHRRLAAASVAKLKTVPCLVRDDLDTDQAQLEAMLVENLQRADLTAVEEAKGYQALLEFPGYTMKRITETTGRTARTVKDRVALAKLPTHTLDKLQAGQLSLAEAHVFIEFAADPAATTELEKVAGTHNWQWTVQTWRNKRDQERKVEKVRKRFETEGVRVLSAPDLAHMRDAEQPPLDDDELIDILNVELPDDCDTAEISTALTVAHHDCPGHAVTIDRYGDAEVHCTRPDLHPVADRPAQPTATPEQLAVREAAEQLNTDLATAAQVRRAHLADVIVRGGDDLAADALRPLAIKKIKQLWAWDPGQRYIAELLAGDPDASRALVFTVVDALRLDQLAILLELLEHQGDDTSMLQRYGYGVTSARDSYKDWRDRLAGPYAYEWSDVELRLIEQGEREAAERAAAKSAQF